MIMKPVGVKEQRLAFVERSKYILETLEQYCDPGVIYGIDPARGSTGYAIRKKGGEIKTGAIVPKTYGFSKAMVVRSNLNVLIGQKRPLLALEGYAHNARFGREKAGELGGLIRSVLYIKKVPLLIVAPLTIKAWIKAKKKEHIMLEILDKYGIKIANQDAADAFVLQEIGHKFILMARSVASREFEDAEEIRLFLKNSIYKNDFKGLDKLFKYQEAQLFRLILSQGLNLQFFLRDNPFGQKED